MEKFLETDLDRCQQKSKGHFCIDIVEFLTGFDYNSTDKIRHIDDDDHSRIYVNQLTDDLDMQYGEINTIEFRFDESEMMPELHDYDDYNEEAAATTAVDDDATDGAAAWLEQSTANTVETFEQLAVRSITEPLNLHPQFL